MRKMTTALLLSASLGATVLPATAADGKDPVSSEQMRKEISEAVTAIKEYSLERRDQALAETRAALDKLDSQIEQKAEALRNKWGEMSTTARQAAAESLQELRDRRNRLGEWYGALRYGADSAWDDIKRGFSDAYADLEAAWDAGKPEQAEKAK
ncbi:hypothetical protein [Breoghania sp. L-A4]|uniref:hypothetical protein n=1 Tax=Breoghania sp. L-A4 TaxID=2304600 RepID=UPI000E35A161|nr:hypothetical protein [Breoghania sp. L-A4]AXS40893.1 hypothetical protein D1F64_13680 [Breoghania sp. L-A4]